ncbi:MAG: sugar ABC transporter permease [Anaerolineae bacterium]
MVSGLRPLGRERLWLLVLLAPTLIGLIFGAFGSILATLGISFLKWDLISAPIWVGIDNYKALLTDKLFLDSLRNTTVFSILYVPSVVVLSLAVALLLNRRMRGVAIFRVLYFLPVITSAVAVGIVWNWIYAPDRGVLNSIIVSLGGQPVRWLSTQNMMMSIVIVNVWGAIGEGMIIFLAGLQAIPREYYEAAEVDGVTAWSRFYRITLPLITPSLFFQLLISTINAFQAFEYIYILTRTASGNSNLPTVVFSIYRNGFNYFRMGTATAQAIVLAVIIMVLTALYFWLQRRWVSYE